jgi:hypothetical protein
MAHFVSKNRQTGLGSSEYDLNMLADMQRVWGEAEAPGGSGDGVYYYNQRVQRLRGSIPRTDEHPCYPTDRVRLLQHAHGR